MEYLEDVRDWCMRCQYATIAKLCTAGKNGDLPCDSFKLRKVGDKNENRSDV